MELEDALSKASQEADRPGHGHAALEHLLLTLTEDQHAGRVMRGCGINLEDLRSTLRNYLDGGVGAPKATGGTEARAAIAFDRVLERSIFHIRSSAGRKLVTGADVLAKLFLEHESRAVCFLHEQGMNRLDAVAYINHLEDDLVDED